MHIISLSVKEVAFSSVVSQFSIKIVSGWMWVTRTSCVFVWLCESFQTLQIEYQLTQPTTANSIKSTQMLVAVDSTQI